MNWHYFEFKSRSSLLIMQIDELNCETAHLSKDFSKNGRSTP